MSKARNLANLGRTINTAGKVTADSFSAYPATFKNRIINGNFDVWQRATSQTSSGYGSDDRWTNSNTGSTKTHSRQTFDLGQTDVPGNPKYFSRTVVTSVAGASNVVSKSQRIESVLTFAGQTVTLSFWAKADATKQMAVEFSQVFGSGGSPSSSVLGIGVNKVTLTTSWKLYTLTVNIPSINGKTFGSNSNDYLALTFWFDAGSTFDSRTSSLGQQSGTFDIAQVQLEAGTVATTFENRPFDVERNLCYRYYEKLGNSGNYYLGIGYYHTSTLARVGLTFYPKRATPTASVPTGAFVIANGSTSLAVVTVSSPISIQPTTIQQDWTTSGSSANFPAVLYANSSDAAINLDAEL